MAGGEWIFCSQADWKVSGRGTGMKGVVCHKIKNEIRVKAAPAGRTVA